VLKNEENSFLVERPFART